MSHQPTSWRSGLQLVTIDEIEIAIETLRSNQRYERSHGSSKSSIIHLEQMSVYARALSHHLNSLSPIATAALHDVGVKEGIETGETDLRKHRSFLAMLYRLGKPAAALIENMAITFSEGGQGSGSGLSKGSDLATLAAGDTLLQNSQFRSSKDKFGVAVVATLARFEPDSPKALWRGKKRLEEFLSLIWEAEDLAPPQSWDRIGRARKKIADMVQRQIAIEQSWDRSLDRVWKKFVAENPELCSSYCLPKNLEDASRLFLEATPSTPSESEETDDGIEGKGSG